MRALPFLLCAVVLTATAADRIGGSLGVTSDYRLQGLSLSAGDRRQHRPSCTFSNPTEDRGALVRRAVGLDGAAQPTSLRRRRRSARSSAASSTLGPDWLGSVALSHYAHPWNALLKHYDYDELTIGASFRDRLKFTAAYSRPTHDLYSHYGFIENRRSSGV